MDHKTTSAYCIDNRLSSEDSFVDIATDELNAKLAKSCFSAKKEVFSYAPTSEVTPYTMVNEMPDEPDCSRFSSIQQENRESELAEWRSAVSEMTEWKAEPIRFDEGNRMDEGALDTAIEYAIRQLRSSKVEVAPDSIVPSGFGRLTMEWNDLKRTVTMEFLAKGKAEITEFSGGKIVHRYSWADYGPEGIARRG